MGASTGYLRTPTVWGERVAFVTEDDVWTVGIEGGVARRLTTSASEDSLPRFSPDGSRIAFVARDEGRPEVYVIPAEGGRPRRLTALGASTCIVCGWTPDGSEILFTSDYDSPFERETQAFAVSAEGGAPRPLQIGHASTVAIAHHGGVLVGRNAVDPARWKRYRGGTAGDLWIDPHGGGNFHRLISLPGNVVWPMWDADGSRIYFLSDHEGMGNVYSVRPDGSDLHRHTDEREYFARFPATDGVRIVYSAGARIRVLDTRDDSVQTLEVETPSSAPQSVRRFIEGSEDLEDFAPAPDGTQIALVTRGQPYTMPLWEEAVTHQGVGSRVRYHHAEWLCDSKRLVVVDDAEGFDRIGVIAADQSEAPQFVTESSFGRITDLAVSPVADEIAFANHRHELYALDLSGKHEPRKLDKSPATKIARPAFSPDGRYLAYTWAPTVDVALVRICKLKSGEIHDVTTPLRVDANPVWDPEGKYLFFLSTRDFNPVYDALQFDLSFPQAMRPFVVTLRRDVPSPFIPKPQPLHRERRHDGDDDKKAKPPRIEIDFEGITGRVLGFPVEEGRYQEIVAARGRALFTRFPVKGIRPLPNTWREEPVLGSLQVFDFESQRLVTLAQEVEEIRLSTDGRTLVYASRERLRAIDAGA
ncbi:MAG: PD40 domain-containing protein, partial [Candidatus Eremiobacteraeota bacterium]|nr:PD40 domain-containing protein [Candidatus Eremiobacteraeota bacterium]